MAHIVPYDPRRPRLLETDPTLREGGAGGYTEPTRESAGLREYLAIFRRHPWLILGMVFAAAAVTFYRVETAPSRFRATSTVKLTDTRRAVTGLSEGSPDGERMGRETDLLASQIQVLLSRQLAGEAVDQAGLRLAPAPEQPYATEIRNIVVGSSTSASSLRFTFGPDGYAVQGSGSPVVSRYGQPLEVDGVTLTVSGQPRVSGTVYHVMSRDAAVGSLLGGLRATPRPHTDIIDVDYTGSEPHYAQTVANTVALAFQLHSAQNAQQQSKRRRVFLEEQLQQTGTQLQKAINDYSNYRSRRQVFSSKEKASAQQSGLINIEMRRADLDAQKRTYESLLAQSQRSRQSSEGSFRALMSAPGTASNPVILQLYGRLNSYESARDSLTTAGAAGSNPDLVAINSLIGSTTAKIVAAVRSQIQGLDAQIASLDTMKAGTAAEMSTGPATEAEEGQLSQQVQNIQKIEDRLQEEYQNAKMTEAVEAGQVEIVDLAELPGGPLAEGRSRNIALGVLIGVMLGFGSAILVDGMNTSIRRRDDIERLLQVPGLAVIPRFVPSASAARRIAAALPSRSGNGNGSRSRPQRASGLVTVHDARSSSAEAYRTLRTNLMFSQAVQTLRTIVVTSPSPGEGKTTTASNLAVSFAQQGMRVLLADCDFRRAKIHSFFGVPRSPGLTELLLGQATQESVIRDASVTGLYLLTSGNLPPNPAELLGSETMRKILESLSEAFDLIVIDTPPLLAASDASILATLADGALLVVKAGATEIEAGQQALQQLSAVGARVVGVVLNDPDAKVQKYGAYYRYEYASQT
jgi:capsular exopolysaccharide synthesis family protein